MLARSQLFILGSLLLLAACDDAADTGGGDDNMPRDGGRTTDPIEDAAIDAGGPPPGGSPGCTASLEAGSREATFDVAGLERTYVLHVPADYDPRTPSPLVINMHGFLSNYMEQVELTGMSDLADDRGVLIAYPNGTGVPPAWNGGDCCVFGADAQDDVAFVAALIDEISKQACVDAKRVYATGYSNGGFLAHRLGCELSDRIAAIASVAGVLGVPPEDCTPDREVPALMFHGSADGTVPYTGGSPAGWELLYPDQQPPVFRSAAETAEHWRTQNGCADTSMTSFMMGDATCESYDDCQNGSEVTFCTIDQGGHTWPGGNSEAFQGMVTGIMITDIVGKTSTAIDASEEILDFFAAHPLE